jgi:hypothetical protein
MTIAALSAFALVGAACGSSSDESETGSSVTVEEGSGAATLDTDDDGLSIVAMGDSVSAGEGIDYGYTYGADLWLPRWQGGTDDPTWQGQYQLCHDSAQAYSDLVATELGASLAKFSCTGATYSDGIVTAQQLAQGDGVDEEMRPAQFGDWTATPEGGSTGTINPEYAAADPDVVLITLGADDLSFVPIVTYCATGFTLEEATRGLAADEPIAAGRAGVSAVVERRQQAAPAEGAALDGASAPEGLLSWCTAKDPGSVIQERFFDQIPTLKADYSSLVANIQAYGRQEQDGKVPKVIFTTYYSPLPTEGESDECLDVGDLDRANLDYLNTLVGTMNSTITTTLGDGAMGDVEVVDISGVMEGHGWCSDAPHAYGLSTLLLNTASQAPFHPTPDGQSSIADKVLAVLQPSG